MKKYSSAVGEGCSVAREFRKIAFVLQKKLLMEKLLKEKEKVTMRDQDCTKNIMVFRLPEKQEEYVDSKFYLLDKMNEKDQILDCHRVVQTQNKSGAPQDS